MKIKNSLPIIALLAFIINGSVALAAGCGIPRICDSNWNRCHAESLEAGFYIGPFGGLQHSRTWNDAKAFDGAGDLLRSVSGITSGCHGNIGALAGYLHRFCDTGCIAGLEAYFQYGFAKGEIKGGTPPTQDTFSIKQRQSFGGHLRMGYIFCDDNLVYGLMGVKYSNLSFCAQTAEGHQGCDDDYFLGLTLGLGVEREVYHGHRVRLQLMHTRYSDIDKTGFISGIGGFYTQNSHKTTEATIGYVYAF